MIFQPQRVTVHVDISAVQSVIALCDDGYGVGGDGNIRIARICAGYDTAQTRNLQGGAVEIKATCGANTVKISIDKVNVGVKLGAAGALQGAVDDHLALCGVDGAIVVGIHRESTRHVDAAGFGRYRNPVGTDIEGAAAQGDVAAVAENGVAIAGNDSVVALNFDVTLGINTADDKAVGVMDIHRLGHLNGVPAGLNKQVGRAVETLHVNTVAAPVDRQLAAALNGQVIVALDREHRKVLIHHKRGIAK